MSLGSFYMSRGGALKRAPSILSRYPLSAGTITSASTPTKFGNSIQFNNAVLSTPVETKFNIPAQGPWTYEAWVYPLAVPNASHMILDNRNFLSSSQTNNRAFMRFRFQRLSFGDGVGFTSGTTPIAINTWYHCAISYLDGTVRVFVNGVLEASGTYSTMNLSQGNHPISLAGSQSGPGGTVVDTLNCYMDEIRVSNIARYTDSFTPQVTPFINDENTLLLIHGDMPYAEYYDDGV